MRTITEIGVAQQLLADGANFVQMPYTGVLEPVGEGAENGPSPVDGYRVALSNPSRLAISTGSLLLNSSESSGRVYLPGEATFGNRHVHNGDLMAEEFEARGISRTRIVTPRRGLQNTARQMEWAEAQVEAMDDDQPTIFAGLPGHGGRMGVISDALGFDSQRTHQVDLREVQQALAPDNLRAARTMDIFWTENDRYEEEAYRKTVALARFGGSAVLLGTQVGAALTGGANVVQIESNGTYWQKRVRQYVRELRQQAAAGAS